MRVTINYGRRTVFDKEFEESKHPRSHGQFTTKGSASGSRVLKTAHLQPASTDKSSWPEHVKALKLPPAWKDVHISHDPEAVIQAAGTDSKGRRIYVYHKKFSESQSAVKFARIQELVQKAHYIRKQNDDNLSSKDPVKREHAEVAALIMEMGIRPGSETDTGAKVKAYGATTLEGRHVVAENGHVRLKFTGKKGVSLDLPVEDPELARSILARARQAGVDGKLFGKVSAGSLLDYVHSFDGGGFKTKDFRTLLATQTANKMVEAGPAPKTESEYKKRVREVADVVSKKLGNTPVVALQSYINPAVFAPWREHAPT